MNNYNKLLLHTLNYYEQQYRQLWRKQSEKVSNYFLLQKCENMLNLLYAYIMENKEQFKDERL